MTPFTRRPPSPATAAPSRKTLRSKRCAPPQCKPTSPSEPPPVSNPALLMRHQPPTDIPCQAVSLKIYCKGASGSPLNQNGPAGEAGPLIRGFASVAVLLAEDARTFTVVALPLGLEGLAIFARAWIEE